MDAAEINRIFFEDGYRLADKNIRNELTPESLLRAIRTLYKSMDSLITSLSERSAREGNPVECKKGCSWCCHQAVFAVSHEFIYLAKYIQHQMSSDDRKRIKNNASLKDGFTSGKSIKELLRTKSPCPLLNKGVCSVYEVRPMACRIYLSTGKASCEKEFHDPEKEKHIPSLLDFPLKAGRMFNEGFVSRLREAGLQYQEMPIERGIKEILSLTDDPVEAWLKEEKVFSDMVYTDEDLKLLNQ